MSDGNEGEGDVNGEKSSDHLAALTVVGIGNTSAPCPPDRGRRIGFPMHPNSGSEVTLGRKRVFKTPGYFVSDDIMAYVK